MRNSLLSEYSRDVWAMEPRALEAFLANLASVSGPSFDASDSANANLFSEAPVRSRMSVAGDVGTISISGVLLKRVPNIMRWLGIDATSYGEIESDMRVAMADEKVKTIRLQIESPGGQTSGVKEAADAIYGARGKKKILAEIPDLGASAAYWLAAQADQIAAGPNAMVGSIGVYTAFLDSSRAAEDQGFKVHLIASGSLKGMGVPGTAITDAQIEAMREVIDGMAANFKADVMRGRAKHIDPEDEDEMMSGRVWLADAAISLGLVDSIIGNPGATTSSDVRSAAIHISPEGEEDMDKEKMAAGTEQIRAEAAAAERKRLVELKATFPEDLEFATAQFESGATIEQAKAAYSDVLRGRLAESLRQNADLKAKALTIRPATGAKPVAAEGSPSEQQEVDFIRKAQLYAAERKCTMREALSFIARTDPESYRRYREHCREIAPEHAAKKIAAGVS